MASAKKQVTKGRGAKAPRSAFRAKPESGRTPKAKAKASGQASRRTSAARVATIAARTTQGARPVETLGDDHLPVRHALRSSTSGSSATCRAHALEPAIVKATRARRPRARRHRPRASAMAGSPTAGTTSSMQPRRRRGPRVEEARRGGRRLRTPRLHRPRARSISGTTRTASTASPTVVFWGRDDGLLAKVMNAPRTPRGPRLVEPAGRRGRGEGRSRPTGSRP